MAEGGGDLGSDVGGPPLLADDVGQQVDEHVVVLQQRHLAVLPLKRYVGPQRPEAHVDLAGVQTLAGLQHRHAVSAGSGYRQTQTPSDPPEAPGWAG